MSLKRAKSILKSARNFAIACFFGWLIFSPVPGENNNKPQQPIETIYVRGGSKENPPPIELPPSVNSNSSVSSPTQSPKVSGSESKSFYAESERVTFKSGSGNSPSGSGNDDPDITIGTKNWEKWVCPEPDEIISNPEFWNKLQKDSETCLNEDEDDYEDMETESTSERPQHRRLLAVNPNPSPVAKSMPTGKLDQQNLEMYDFTTKKVQPFQYYSREGIPLSADQRSLRKLIYGHASELGLSDLMNRIPCPIQLDSNKFQRVNCWAITDRNMKDALTKVFEYTTSMDPNIVTVEMPMHEGPYQRATYFINKTTGSSLYFHKDGKQAGKLWSGAIFDPADIPKMLKQPEVKVITDLNNNEL
jgi:hypothetical protein